MAFHIFSVPCLRVIQDAGNNLLSLIDIVERGFNRSGEKMTIPAFKFVSKWGKSGDLNDKESFELKFSIIGPNGKHQDIHTMKAEIPDNAMGIALITDFSPIPINETGTWFLVVSFRDLPNKRWKEATRVPFAMIVDEKALNKINSTP